MYIFPKVKRLVFLLFSLYCLATVASFWFGSPLAGILVAVFGLIAVLFLYLTAQTKAQNAVLAILNSEQNPKAFLYSIAPILKEATTVDKGMFTWKSLEALAMELMGKEEEAFSLRRYLSTMTVGKHEEPLLALLNGSLALDYLQKGQRQEALNAMEQMELYFGTHPADARTDPSLREIRCLWEYYDKKQSHLCYTHYHTVLTSPHSTPLEITLAHFTLASILSEEQRKQEALPHWEAVVRRAPHLAIAQKAQKLIEEKALS